MAYCIHAGGSVRDAIRRIGLEQIDGLLLDLRGTPDAHRIHDARKRCKMLRALLCLARGGLEGATRRDAVKRWRDVAAALGRARDATVRLDTFRQLISRPNSCRDLATRLEADAEAARHTTVAAPLLQRLETRINVGRRTWSRTPLRRGGWRAIEHGLRESYREARNALSAIRDDSLDDELHEWRKRTKTLWYHIRLLIKVRPKKLRPLADTLEKIGELMGNDHDLAMLRAFAREHDGESLHVLEPLIAHQRERLQRKARALARPIFEQRPREFTTQFETWWKRWRRQAQD